MKGMRPLPYWNAPATLWKIQAALRSGAGCDTSRQSLRRRHGRWPPALTVSLRPSSSNTSVVMPSRSWHNAPRFAGPGPPDPERLVGEFQHGISGGPRERGGQWRRLPACAGKVSRHIFLPLFPHWPEDEVPIGHVTNRENTATPELGLDPPMIFGRTPVARGVGWGRQKPWSRTFGESPDSALWKFRTAASKSLVEYARGRLSRQPGCLGASAEAVDGAKHLFDPNALTLGFAARFATYETELTAARPAAAASFVD